MAEKRLSSRATPWAKSARTKLSVCLALLEEAEIPWKAFQEQVQVFDGSDRAKNPDGDFSWLLNSFNASEFFEVVRAYGARILGVPDGIQRLWATAHALEKSGWDTLSASERHQVAAVLLLANSILRGPTEIWPHVRKLDLRLPLEPPQELVYGPASLDSEGDAVMPNRFLEGHDPRQTGSRGMVAPLRRAEGEETLPHRRGRPRKQTQERIVRVQFDVSVAVFQVFEEVKQGLGSTSQAEALRQITRFADWYLDQQEGGYTLVARDVSGLEKTNPPTPATLEVGDMRRLQIDVPETTRQTFAKVRKRLGYGPQAKLFAHLVQFSKWYLEVRGGGGSLILSPAKGTESREVVVVVL